MDQGRNAALSNAFQRMQRPQWENLLLKISNIILKHQYADLRRKHAKLKKEFDDFMGMFGTPWRS